MWERKGRSSLTQPWDVPKWELLLLLLLDFGNQNEHCKLKLDPSILCSSGHPPETRLVASEPRRKGGIKKEKKGSSSTGWPARFLLLSRSCPIHHSGRGGSSNLISEWASASLSFPPQSHKRSNRAVSGGRCAPRMCQTGHWIQGHRTPWKCH